MNKTFMAATLVGLTTSAVFANTIVPEISRDGKTKNDSTIAVTQQMRSFIAAEYNSTTFEPDAGGEIDTTNFDIFGGWSNKMLSIEADLDFGNVDTGAADTDFTTYDIKAGFRLNKEFALGLGYQMIDTDPNNEVSTIEIAASYNMNNFIIGASFSIVDEDTGSADGSHSRIIFGVGSNETAMSWEAGLQFDLEEKDDAVTSPSRTKLFAGTTMIIGEMEIDGDIDYTTGDFTVAGGDFSELHLNIDAEFMVGGMFYITPGIEYTTTDNNGTDTDQLDLSADFGYRANMIDATFGIDYALMGEVGIADYDEMAWKINVAYLF
ncbi:hypothetical protein M902_1927 [Bacteriovorax sp. BAL6_X]|uniref:porin n=1 Tax=Bacteriovorax sp. BAL6_X TaxID=1201290 RepID=UPI000386AB5A|nr:porin [Bacteriovorax sp. BAL6_X]EPZ51930.1 hypothetical protein M902_1927 [Bacteriovorax sp. BAL6_X]